MTHFALESFQINVWKDYVLIMIKFLDQASANGIIFFSRFCFPYKVICIFTFLQAI